MADNLDTEKIFNEDEIGEIISNNDQKSEIFNEQDIGIESSKIIQKSPLTFGERAVGGFATEAGKELKFQQKFGKDNVRKLPDGEFIIRQKDENGQELWYTADPEGFRVKDFIGDFADVVADIPTMVLSGAGAAAGGGTPGSIAGAGLGAALGEEVKIIAGNILGVRPDDTALQNAADVAFSGLINSAFQGVSKIPAVKQGATRLGQIISRLGEKVDQKTIKPLIKFLTNMPEMHAQRGLLRPSKVLTKENMAPDATNKISKSFINWFDRTEKLAGNNFNRTIQEISKNKKIAVSPDKGLNKIVNRFSEEFDSLAKEGVRIPKSKSNIVGKVIGKINKGEDLSFKEAQQFKRAISSKINPNAFKAGAVADEINVLENKIRKSMDESIRASLPFKERRAYDIANNRFQSFANMRVKMGRPKKTEELDAVKGFLTKVSKVTPNGDDFAFSDREVIKKMQSFDPSKFNMMEKIDDVFAAQEWAKKEGRFDSIMNRAIGLSVLAEVGNPALASNIPTTSLIAGALSIKAATKPINVSRVIKSKNSVAKAISNASKFRGNPQLAAEIARNSRDEDGNAFDQRTVRFIINQANNLTEESISKDVVRHDITSSLTDQENIKKRINQAAA